MGIGRRVVRGLPDTRTSFVGREADIDLVAHLFAKSRLITLTGPGGVGKTRLAIEVARRLSKTYAGGAEYVELAPIRDPDLVDSAIAASIGVTGASDEHTIEAVCDQIADADVLLVLDNFEQVLDAAPTVARLLNSCSGLRTLVTSRRPLGLAGEQEYRVPPLAMPNEEQELRADVMPVESVALFLERTRAIAPRIVLTNDDLYAIAQICRRLDGIPLAIELAAAR